MQRTILGIVFSLTLATSAAAVHRPMVSVEDLTLLSATDLSNETILVFLAPREIGFGLDPKTIARLRQQGVSDEIIRFLLEREGGSREQDTRVAIVSADPYPSRYHGFYYRHRVARYYESAILSHWIHGYRWVGDHLGGGYHFGSSVGHFASHGRRHYASNGHFLAGNHARGHSSRGHGVRNLFGSHGVSHAGAAHSGHGQRGSHRSRGH